MSKKKQRGYSQDVVGDGINSIQKVMEPPIRRPDRNSGN